MTMVSNLRIPFTKANKIYQLKQSGFKRKSPLYCLSRKSSILSKEMNIFLRKTKFLNKHKITTIRVQNGIIKNKDQSHNSTYYINKIIKGKRK